MFGGGGAAVSGALTSTMFGGGSRRREAPSDTSDDPLADILSKLGLGGGDGSTVARDVEAAVQVLVDVLEIDWDQAKFFLESAANDVAVAVNLHFELVGQSAGKRNRPAFDDGFGAARPAQASHYSHASHSQPRWAHREVAIEGLPEGWSAFVSATTGTIVFHNRSLGAYQNTVPAGFADPSPGDDEDGMGAAIGGAADDEYEGGGGGLSGSLEGEDMPGLEDSDGGSPLYRGAAFQPAAQSTFPSPAHQGAGAGAFDFSPRATGGRGFGRSEGANSAPPAFFAPLSPASVPATAPAKDGLEGPLLTEGDSFDEDL